MDWRSFSGAILSFPDQLVHPLRFRTRGSLGIRWGTFAIAKRRSPHSLYN